MKKNCSFRNLKYTGDAIFRNSIKVLPLISAGSALKCYETQVREVDRNEQLINSKKSSQYFVNQFFFNLKKNL